MKISFYSQNKRSRSDLHGKNKDVIHWYQDLICSKTRYDPVTGKTYQSVENQKYYLTKGKATSKIYHQVQRILLNFQPNGLTRQQIRSMYRPIEGGTSCLFCGFESKSLALMIAHVNSKEHKSMMIRKEKRPLISKKKVIVKKETINATPEIKKMNLIVPPGFDELSQDDFKEIRTACDGVETENDCKKHTKEELKALINNIVDG